MKLLFKALLRARRHASLFAITFLALAGLTVTSQMEMVTLGILTSRGVDFFSLFPSESDGKIQLETVQQQWKEIDPSFEGIDSQKASEYLTKTGKYSLLQKALHFFESKVHFSQDSIEILIVLIVTVALLKATFLFFSRYTTTLLAIRISRDLREQFFQHIQYLPMSFFHQHNIGSISTRVITDAQQISQSINSLIYNYLHAPFTVVTSLIGCFYFSWQLSLIIFIGVPLIALPIILLTKKVKQISRLFQKNQERFASLLIDFLSGIQTIKMFRMERFALEKYKEENNQMAFLQSKTAKYDLLTRPVLHTVTSFCLATVLIGGLHILKMSPSQLFVFCGLLYLFYEPIKKFADENANIQKGVVAAQRLFEVLSIPHHQGYSTQNKTLVNFTSDITFDRVSFKYKDEWVLRDISCTIKKGECIALIGATGSGKSTFAQLIPRLYDIQQGQIFIDGASIESYTQSSLRKQIGYVSQKPFLFTDTIAANIAAGHEVSLEKIQKASKQAHADEFIEVLSDGYFSKLEEMGKNFSGGQQQRIAIARALVQDAPILIFDEATSALDAISEEKITQTIEELKGEKTLIIVAHRLSTIKHVDRVLFFDKGLIIGDGSIQELMQSCPPFKKMWETYFKSASELSMV